MRPGGQKDADRASFLRVGFRIDMLSAIMFVMVTFIGTFIHLFSMGYMDDELKTTVEDHEVLAPRARGSTVRSRSMRSGRSARWATKTKRSARACPERQC